MLATKYLRNAVVNSPPVLLADNVVGGATVILLVPIGYDELILHWSNVYVDHADLQNLQMTLVSGAGGYDYSRVAFGGALATSNAANFILLGQAGDSDDVIQVSSGLVTISNRAGQEKVVIGTEVYFDNSAGALADDVTGYHIEGKDRDTSSAFTSVVLAMGNGNIAALSRFILLGINTKEGG